MNSRQLIRAIKQESAHLAETDTGMGSQRETEMIDQWREIRPQMVQRLESMGVLKEFAHILECRRADAVQEYIQTGMPIPDAREQANLDWTLMEPEEDDPDGDSLDKMLEAVPSRRQPRKLRMAARRARNPQPT